MELGLLEKPSVTRVTAEIIVRDKNYHREQVAVALTI
jgi:hypothetical protein